MNETGGNYYLVNEPGPSSSTYITVCISRLSGMHKPVYCVCIICEHSTKFEELLYAFSLYIGAPGADILGILGV